MENTLKSFIQQKTKLDFDVLKKWTANIPTEQDEFYREMKKVLVDKIRQLILKDFDGLLRILYRTDVSEAKIKQTLKDHEEKDAAEIIAELYLQRLIEKYQTKKEYRDNKEGEWIFDI
jgi:hypothetical protein